MEAASATVAMRVQIAASFSALPCASMVGKVNTTSRPVTAHARQAGRVKPAISYRVLVAAPGTVRAGITKSALATTAGQAPHAMCSSVQAVALVLALV